MFIHIITSRGNVSLFNEIKKYTGNEFFKCFIKLIRLVRVNTKSFKKFWYFFCYKNVIRLLIFPHNAQKWPFANSFLRWWWSRSTRRRWKSRWTGHRWRFWPTGQRWRRRCRRTGQRCRFWRSRRRRIGIGLIQILFGRGQIFWDLTSNSFKSVVARTPVCFLWTGCANLISMSLTFFNSFLKKKQK